MKNATASATIEASHTVFYIFGLPEMIVSDNGPQFMGEELGMFMWLNNIVYLRTALYHPQLNGLAGCAAHTIKQELKKNKRGSLQTRLARILHSY